MKSYKLIIFISIISFFAVSCNNLDSKNKEAIILLQNNEYEKANIIFSEIITTNHNFLPAYYNRAISNSRIKKSELSIKDLNYLISKQAYANSALFNRALLHENNKNYSLAIKDYSKIIRREPNNTQAIMYKGVCFFYLNKIDLAILNYKKAINKGLKSSALYYNIAVAYNCKNDTKKALEYYDKAIVVDNKLARAFLARAIVNYKLGNKEEAINDLVTADDLNLKEAKDFLSKIK